MLSKMLPQTWNDMLSLIVLIGVPALWVFGNLSETMVGATIMGWTLVLQFYFRQRPTEPPPSVPIQ